MNKTAIRNFAVSARKKLIDDVKQKAYQLGITESEIKEPEIYQDGFRINQQFYKKYEIKQREKLLKQIEDKGFGQVMEEVAYTWFNRFIAIRFMEVNNYLPTGVRLFSSIIEGKTEPDAVTEVEMIAEELELDMELVYRLQDSHDTEELFKYILVKQCNKLGEIMPVVFERIADYTELLLPDQLLAEGSVIRDMVDGINESDWKEEVEIIGWLYQYYISEKKDEVFEGLRKRKKITKENIPAATQLFTPKWIVQYMVENSLGRLWLESHPNEQLQASWDYYIEEAEQEPEVQAELDKLKNPNLKPEEITILDPAVGSGHILVYAFDVLHQIYETAGYAKRDIPKLILENNLYGLDIDDRAAQLAYFALLMKACSYNRRILDEPIQLHVRAIQESNTITKEQLENVLSQSQYDGDKEKLQAVLEPLIDVFHDAKEYGSILNVEENDYELVENWLETLKNEHFNDMFVEHDKEQILEVLPDLIHQAKIMSKKYDVTITNPPYMGRGGMNPKLTKFLDKHYKVSKSDLFAVFMDVCLRLAKEGKFASMINQQSWMFLSAYEKLRKKVLQGSLILSMLHLGPRAFEEIAGEVVQSTAFILRKQAAAHFRSPYIRLVEISTALEKKKIALEAIKTKNPNYYYLFDQAEFNEIPGSPIAYNLSEDFLKLFKAKQFLGDIAEFKTGLIAGKNAVYYRFWTEVEFPKIGFGYKSTNETETGEHKWFPLNHGGDRCKWYGSHLEVVNFYKNAKEMRSEKNSMLRNEDYYFKKGLNWNRVGSNANFAARISEVGFVFDDVSPSGFVKDEKYFYYVIGFMNTRLFNDLLKIVNTGFKTEVGHVAKVPIVLCDDSEALNRIHALVQENIRLSRWFWDLQERSYHFQSHVLAASDSSLASRYEKVRQMMRENYDKLKENEWELNKRYCEIFQVPNAFHEEQVDLSVRLPSKIELIQSFISYAVGCMFGRYSLDEEGLVYAGGAFDPSKYLSFPADADNVIPITDEDYFDDDIAARFVEFVRTVYGDESLEENLDFIAEALSKRGNETARQRIRRYFLNEFYADHVRTYQKRPIYWQFDSGRQNGFKALIYMHRYEPSLVARVRTEYLHMMQRKYESEMQRLDGIIESDVSKAEKRAAVRQKEKVQKQWNECREYDQVMAHLANQQINIDLDDGVEVNYAKFQNIEVPQGEGKPPLIANLLKKL